MAPSGLEPAGESSFLANDLGNTQGVAGAIVSTISELMKPMAKPLRNKRELLLNWFRADGAISSGVVEGFNNKLKAITRKSYDIRTQKAYETALYHNLGALPEPEFTHRFF